MINEEKARKDALYFMGELALQAKQEQFRLAGEAYMEELTALRNRYYPILSSSLKEIQLLKQAMQVEI
jgi:hypothetical protein